ncbi:hypothetical protein MATL_G00222370 [Megalops atlanticus]|uniref:Uncharacterized protein n=1 Tax=Megalops atlanticus TaxID=7932 RepID=A0A9D3PGG9_MEGAT|nr:hypothetical protein MATL_G00222370 [Megalops atlanticus]
MQRVTMVMCLIGLSTSLPVLNEHKRTERSASNENTSRANVGGTQPSTGVTGRGFGGTGRSYQYPSQPSYPTGNPYAPTQPYSPYNPYALPPQPYPPFIPIAPRTDSSTALLAVLPFLVTRLAASATPLAAPMNAGK